MAATSKKRTPSTRAPEVAAVLEACASVVKEASAAVQKAAASQCDAVANLTSTNESTSRLNDGLLDRIRDLVDDNLTLARLLAASEQKSLESNQLIAAQEAHRLEKEIELERSKQIFAMVRDLGSRVFSAYAAPKALGATQRDEEAEGETLATVAGRILQKLSPETQAAFVADAGEEDVQLLVALIVGGAGIPAGDSAG